MAMDSSEISLIKFNMSNYFYILINAMPFKPISTLLVKVVEALISSESTPDKESQKKIKWIYENTHKEVMKPLPVVELAVFKNLDKSLNREIDFGDNTFYLSDLYRYLDEVSKELTMIVISIAKKYAIDMPTFAFGKGGTESRIDIS
jgi:hypothetical protein